jgi:glycerol kinase
MSSHALATSRYVLAIDQGTTSSRAMLFDRQGKVVASAQEEFPQYFPQPGWVEHDATQIWDSQRRTIVQVLNEIGARAGDVAAIGLTNQRETTVTWDKSNSQALGRAIVWQDRRTASACTELKQAGHEPMVRERTGLVLDPYFSASKLAWLLKHNALVRAAADRHCLAFGTVDSWLLWNLSAGAAHATDPSNASRTQLLNINTLQWDNTLLDLFGIPPDCLPDLVPSGAVAALCRDDLHPALRRVPIAGIAGDQHAALFGQACFTPGMAKNTYGTGCFALLNAGNTAPHQHLHSNNGLLATIAWQHAADTIYALEGSVFMGGAVVQWLRDGLGIIEQASQIEMLAASVSSSEGVVLVPAFTGLGTPYWDPNARGTIVGLTRGSTKAHIARAALDAIALQSAELIQAMAADSGHPVQELRVDGGACANNFLMQLQADILGVPVLRPRVAETTALGAAYLAGLATGFWASKEEIADNWQLDRRFEPATSTDEAQARMHQWRRAVDRSRDWAHG